MPKPPQEYTAYDDARRQLLTVSTEDPKALVLAPRKPGRPYGSRLTEPRRSISAWLPNSTHDRLIDLAALRDESVSSVMRMLIIRGLTAMKRE